MPTRALIRVSASCDSVPDHSPFFIRNQVRSETSPRSAQTSGPVRRQISARRTIPSTADGVSRSRAEASERFGAVCPTPGSIAGRIAAWFMGSIRHLADNILPIGNLASLNNEAVVTPSESMGKSSFSFQRAVVFDARAAKYRRPRADFPVIRSSVGLMGASVSSAVGFQQTVLASFLVCPERLDEPTLSLRDEYRPAIAAAEGQIGWFFAYQNDLFLNRAIGFHNSDRAPEDSCDQQLSGHISADAVDRVGFKFLDRPCAGQFVAPDSIGPYLTVV